MSDRTWIPGLGRRRPYFLLGAIGLQLVSVLLSARYRIVGLPYCCCGCLDISNNTAMEPFRAFIADTVPERQQSTGCECSPCFTGLGITLANVSLLSFGQIGWLQQTS